MDVDNRYYGTSTSSLAGALVALIILIVVIVLIVMFVVWLIWYYWDCDRVYTCYKSFKVDCDRSACINVCKKSFIQRIALCAEDDGEVWIETGCGREAECYKVCAGKTLWWQPEDPELVEGYDIIVSSDVRVHGVATVLTADVCRGCKIKCKKDKCDKKDNVCKKKSKKKGHGKKKKHDDDDCHSDW